MYVRRPPNTGNEVQDTKNTVKHGGAKVMIWQCFSCNGFVPIHEIKGIMDHYAANGCSNKTTTKSTLSNFC